MIPFVPPPRPIAVAAMALLLAGCASMAPPYERPTVSMQAVSFKEAPDNPGWRAAHPADAQPRGPWWRLFGDDTLNALLPQVEVSNQNVAAAVAAYAQAQALVREQRAALFPTVGADASARRASGGSTSFNGNSRTATSLQLDLAANGAPAIWGRLRRGVEGAQANAQASAAQLAAAQLSAQGEAATSYFSLRDADVELRLLRTTVEGYARALQITQNRYAAGIAPRTDVLQAQTQLDNARADLAALGAQRAQFEHAIAVLVGKPPTEFELPAGEWNMRVPAVPLGVPSELLQRRPDIAAAERAVAAANAQIGIARSACSASARIEANWSSTDWKAASTVCR
jgi:NodT family efflux transporter outer membrane factor (OMF) lipoprotein